MALELADEHGHRLRHIAQWGRWMLFEGGYWKIDQTLWTFDQARRLCRQYAAAAKGGLRRKISSHSTVAGVVSLLRTDRRIAATIDQWDIDPMLLNTPAGAINLATGALRDARPEDHCTKVTSVAPARGLSECPQWIRFLDRISGGDVELVEFLQRMCGYALTGKIEEEAIFFIYGTGRNGKSKFLQVLVDILGSYHEKAAMATFTADRGQERHPTEIAKLMGARLVTAVETEEDRQWAEAKIKAMTGGDKLTARFMRADFFDFYPQYTLIIVGNHKPGLKTVDVAIRRRFHVIPFSVTIPEHEQDPKLGDKLREEYPAILTWMIAGCLAWQIDGLNPPAAVTEATASYLDSEDSIADWMSESGNVDPGAFETRAALYASWKDWCFRMGEHAGPSKEFFKKLLGRGLAKHKRDGKRGFKGFELHSTAQTRQSAFQDPRYGD